MHANMIPGARDTEAGGYNVKYSKDTGARNQQQRLRVGEQPRRAQGGVQGVLSSGLIR